MKKGLNREDLNNQIIQKISLYVNKYPEMRFEQALINLGICDMSIVDGKPKYDLLFYRESCDTLSNIQKREQDEKISK